MTNEKKELLEPVIRSIMESKGHATDEEVAKAMEVFDTLTENKTAYSYEHPDYGPMVKEVPTRPHFHSYSKKMKTKL